MPKFAKGPYPVKNQGKYVGGKTPTYRSSWEMSFMKFCDENCHVIHWASEAIKIPYRNPLTGKSTIYVPDFFIVYVDKNSKQHAELIEIKPEKQTVYELAKKSRINKEQWIVNKAKWEAALAWCSSRGIKFRVLTEHDLYINTRTSKRNK
jgi:hypothetical protein